MRLRRRLRHWLRRAKALDDRVVETYDLDPAPGPFVCVWCREDGQHALCTGKAVRPHLEGVPLLFPRRVGTTVEDCSCALAGHVLRQG